MSGERRLLARFGRRIALAQASSPAGGPFLVLWTDSEDRLTIKVANVGVDVRACVLHWDPLERVTAHDVEDLGRPVFGPAVLNDDDAVVGLHTFVVFLYRPPHTVFTDPDLVILRIDLPEAAYPESEIDDDDDDGSD